MAYAFPRAFTGAGKRYPALASLAAAVAKRRNIARYLASDRRIPFDELRDLPPLSGAGSGGARRRPNEGLAVTI